MIKWMKDKWLPSALWLAVGLSVIFSISVWLNPYRLEPTGLNEGTTSNVDQNVIQTVYQANQVIWNQADGSQKLLFGQPSNVALTLQQSLPKWEFGSVKQVSDHNRERYLARLRQSNAIVISFPGELASNILKQSYHLTSDDFLGKVDRLVIPLQNPREIYLLQDRGLVVRRLRVKQSQLAGVRQALGGGKKIDVEAKVINQQPVMTFPHAFELPNYQFQLTTDEGSTLAAALLTTKATSNVHRQHSNGQTTYWVGKNRRVIVDDQTGKIQYEQYVGTSQVRSLGALQTWGLRQLTQANLGTNSFRYAAISTSGQTITYRNSVQGLLVFSDQGDGSITLKANNDGLIRWQFSRYRLGTPVATATNAGTRLPATGVVMNQLKEAGKLSDIAGLQLGYRWTQVNGNQVNVQPSYFVYYHGNWVDYKTILSLGGQR